jgi:hypothetical protein
MANNQQRRYTSITHYFEDDAAKVWDKRLDELQVAYFAGQKSRYQMLDWLLQFAVRFHWQRFLQGIGPSTDSTIAVDGYPAIVVIADELRLYEDQLQMYDKLSALYEAAGLDKFVEFCSLHNIDWEGFLNGDFSLTGIVEESWSTKADRTLALYLQDEPKTVAEIRTWAEESGLVSSEEDWRKLKVVATRKGYSSAAGYGGWAVPKRKR